MTGYKGKMSQVTDVTEEENVESMAGPYYNHGPRVKFVFLYSVVQI